MGKVRTKEIKNSTWELLEKFPDKFSTDFQENKEFLKKNNLVKNKRLRNRVAGYMTRAIEQKEKLGQTNIR